MLSSEIYRATPTKVEPKPIIDVFVIVMALIIVVATLAKALL